MENGGHEAEIWVPPILRVGSRGVRAKIWTFIYLNRSKWFTARDISTHLEMPLSTVQVALKDLLLIAPRIQSNDKDRFRKGRPEKEYSFS